MKGIKVALEQLFFSTSHNFLCMKKEIFNHLWSEKILFVLLIFSLVERNYMKFYKKVAVRQFLFEIDSRCGR